MFNIRIHSIVFQLCLMKQKERERRWTKLKFLCLVFSTLLNDSRTFRVDLALEQLRDVVCKLFALLCFVFLWAAPIPYVQAAILNLPDPQLRSTTVLLDNGVVLLSVVGGAFHRPVHCYSVWSHILFWSCTGHSFVRVDRCFGTHYFHQWGKLSSCFFWLPLLHACAGYDAMLLLTCVLGLCVGHCTMDILLPSSSHRWVWCRALECSGGFPSFKWVYQLHPQLHVLSSPGVAWLYVPCLSGLA